MHLEAWGVYVCAIPEGVFMEVYESGSTFGAMSRERDS